MRITNHRLKIAMVGLLSFGVMAKYQPCIAQANRTLQPGETLKATISANQIHYYTVDLPPRSIALLRTKEETKNGIDIISEWDSIFLAKEHLRRNGEQTIIILGEKEATTHVIKITSIDTIKKSGDYSLQFVSIRPIMQQDIFDTKANLLYSLLVETSNYNNRDSLKKVYSNLYDLVASVSDTVIKANIAQLVGYALVNSRYHVEGREYLELSLKLFSAFKNDYAIAVNLQGIADSYYRQGNKVTQIKYESEAANIYKRIGANSMLSQCYNNIGLSYAMMENTEKGMLYYQKALKTIPDSQSELAGTILNNIGLEFAKKRITDSAIYYYKKAIPLRRSRYSRIGQAQSMTNLAIELTATGKTDSAIKLIRSAIVIADSENDRFNSMFYRSRLASTYYGDMNDEKTARQLLDSALSISAENSSAQGEIHHQLAHIEMDGGNWKEALVHVNYMTAERDFLWNINIKGESSKEYGEGRLHPYYLKVKCLMELGKLYKDYFFYDSAAVVASSIKGRSFVKEWEIGKKYGSQIYNNPLFIRLVNSIANIYLFETRKPARKEKLQAELERYHKEVSDLDTFGSTSEALNDFQTPVPDNSIEILLGNKESYAWIKIGGKRSVHYLPDRDFFDSMVAQINAGIELYFTLQKDTREKYQALIIEKINKLSAPLVPLLTHFKDNKVLVCRDGPLSLIPFQLLNLDTTHATYRPAVTNIQFAYLPSFRFHWLTKDAGKALASDKILIVSDPIFARNDERLLTGLKQGKTPFLGLQRLKNSYAESEKIARYFNNTTFITGQNSNKTHLLSLDLKKIDYLHFATHSIYDLEIPDLGSIALSFFDKKGNPLNPFLFSFEIQNLDINAKLVVLGSCFSGFGKAYTTEGALSLERAFLVAGASSIISSNWAVVDNFSGDFFSRFYSYHINDGLEISAALQQTQLDFWNAEGLSSLLSWSTFTYTGKFGQ